MFLWIILTILISIYFFIVVNDMSISSTSPLSCDHIYHLFESPFCERLSLWRRIAIIAFHILTLGIPLLLYHVISYYFNWYSPPLEIEPKMKSVKIFKNYIIDNVRNTLCELGSKVLAEQSKVWFGSITYPPVNEYFSSLVKVFWEIKFKEFVQALKSHPKDPWAHKDVLDAADMLMQISYTISIYVLKDLPKYVRDIQLKGYPEQDIYTKLFLDPQCYPSFMLYYCSQVYAWIQLGVVWDDESQSLQIPSSIKTIDSTPGLVGIYSNMKFYDNTLPHHAWRLLYNDFCENASQILGSVTKGVWLPKKDIDIRKYLLFQESVFKDQHIGREQRLLVAPYGKLKDLIERSSKDRKDKQYVDIWLKHLLSEEKSALEFSQSVIEDLVKENQAKCKHMIYNRFGEVYYKHNVNSEIKALYNEYINCELNFRSLINKYSDQAWEEQEEVLQIANQAMKLAYTIGVLMLEDLSNFCTLYQFTDCEEALLDDYSCLSTLLLLFPNLYRHCRRGLVQCKIGDHLMKDGSKKYKDSYEHIDLFFLDSGMYRTWKNMYNQYVKRLEKRLSSGKFKTEVIAILDYLKLDLRLCIPSECR